MEVPSLTPARTPPGLEGEVEEEVGDGLQGEVNILEDIARNADILEAVIELEAILETYDD